MKSGKQERKSKREETNEEKGRKKTFSNIKLDFF